MRSEVFTGLVAVANPSAEQTVKAGFGIAAEKGQALKDPVALLQAPTLLMESYQMEPAKLLWSPIEGAQNYNIQLLHDDPSQEQLLFSEISSATSYTLPIIKTGCYIAQVRAVDQHELQGIAAKQSICISHQLGKPTVESINVKVVEKAQLSISWARVPNAASYTVEISQYEDFRSTLASIDTDLTSIVTTVEDSELYIRVRAVGSHGELGEFSDSVKWSVSPIKKVLAVIAAYIVIVLAL